MTQADISAVKRHIGKIFEAEGTLRIVCDRHTYRITKDGITSYTFDEYGVFLEGNICCTYQASCVFKMVYIPFGTITAITGEWI